VSLRSSSSAPPADLTNTVHSTHFGTLARGNSSRRGWALLLSRGLGEYRFRLLAGLTGSNRRGERRRVVRPALALVLLLAIALPLSAQLPADGRTSYARDDRIRIPFELRTGGPATKVVLYYSFDGGEWQEFESARPGGKREFLFKADREGPYSFATMTYFSDGRTDPPRKDQLAEQKRVVFDKTPPKVQSLRAIASADGAPGIDWEVLDEYMDPKGIKLEFRWDGQGRFEPIDRNVPFAARDTRHWKMQPDDRMQVRVVATDRAGNKTESEPVWVSARDAGQGGAPVPRAPAVAGTTSGARDAEPIQRVGGRAQPTLHYVNTRALKITVYATVGPSGLTKATLWAADDKLDWRPAKDGDKGPMPAPAVSDPDKPRKIPVTFTFDAPTDGLYHFISVVNNHVEASRPDPKKGEAGDLQVVVDTTKPEVVIVGQPKVTSNGDRGAVVNIKWKATDANIAPVPIKLEYQAVRRDRPGEVSEWKAITPQEWIDNTGQHTWPAPTSEAYEFLIRITCKDRAGNEAKVETTKPVNVDLERPRVDYGDVVPGRGAPGGSVSSIPDVPAMSVEPNLGPRPK